MIAISLIFSIFAILLSCICFCLLKKINEELNNNNKEFNLISERLDLQSFRISQAFDHALNVGQHTVALYVLMNKLIEQKNDDNDADWWKNNQ